MPVWPGERPRGWGFTGSYGMQGQPGGWWGGALPNGFYRGGALPIGFYANPPYVFGGSEGSQFGGGPANIVNNVAPVKQPPAYRVTWDTIGQTIYRAIGHVRLPLFTLWCEGIVYPQETESTTSPTLTFAAAMCAPIDPTETGQVVVLLSGNNVIYNANAGGVQIPDGLSVEDANALQLSLQNAVVYPGDEKQEASPLIVADRGADKTNAFRGIRYIVLPLYPLIEGFGSLSIIWNRTGGASIGAYTSAAVEFEAGAA